MLISEDVGDFLILNYEVSGHAIHVQESGVTVSLRVDFPEVLPVADDPAGFIRKCLTDFLNIPEDVVLRLDGKVKEEHPLYVAFLRLPQMPGSDPQRPRWWDYLSVCTDGRFFFVWVPERKTPPNPQMKPGLPDRF